MAIGILASLAITTVLYVVVAAVLIGLVSYTQLNVADPLAVAIDSVGFRFSAMLVKIGATAALSSSMIVMLLGQSRIFYSMSRDGLLPRWAGVIHPRFRTPYICSLIVGVGVSVLASVVPIEVLGQLVNIGTLLAFVIVCAGIWILRRTQPDLPRPFKTPWVPFIPILGIVFSLILMLALSLLSWLRLLVWLTIGLVIYFAYGRSHSQLTFGREVRNRTLSRGD